MNDYTNDWVVDIARLVSISNESIQIYDSFIAEIEADREEGANGLLEFFKNTKEVEIHKINVLSENLKIIMDVIQLNYRQANTNEKEIN